MVRLKVSKNHVVEDTETEATIHQEVTLNTQPKSQYKILEQL